MSDPIYLDYNATTPVSTEVFEAMAPWLREGFGNPSSDHVFGRRARAAVDRARAEVAALIGAGDDEIVFTSGGTEANNLAIFGVMQRQPPGRRVLTSTIEHPATSVPCRRLEAQGFGVDRIAVDSGGRVRTDRARDAIGSSTALVSVMHSNNETGVIQPLAELSRLARSAGALVHTDAAQSAGKVALSVDALGTDLLSIAGHKLYAPKGVGALYVRRGVELEPVLLGAAHERGLRPGTENVASIVALGTACRIAASSLSEESARVARLRDRLWALLSAEVLQAVQNGDPAERLPNTLNLRFPGVRGSAVLALAPEIAASTGSACHEGGESASGVLLAMGIEPEAALGAVRLTLGRHTSLADVECAAAALARAFAQAARSRESGAITG
jgi:cysteine desulfurase